MNAALKLKPTFLTLRKNKNAFTLIEVLLAAALMSIIGLTVYSVFASGISLSRRSELQGNVYKEILWTFDIMAGEMESMLPYDFEGSYPDKKAFSGSDSKVVFLIGGENGIKAVSYYLIAPERDTIRKVVMGGVYKKNVSVNEFYTKEEPVNYLIREEIPFTDFLNGNRSGDGEAEILAVRVKEGGLKFSYGYKESEESESFKYKDEWNSSFIPSIVKIEMEYISGETMQVVPVERAILIPTGFLGVMEDV